MHHMIIWNEYDSLGQMKILTCPGQVVTDFITCLSLKNSMFIIYWVHRTAICIIRDKIIPKRIDLEDYIRIFIKSQITESLWQKKNS